MTNDQLIERIKYLKKILSFDQLYQSKLIEGEDFEVITIGASPARGDSHYENTLMEVWNTEAPAERLAEMVCLLFNHIDPIIEALKLTRDESEADIAVRIIKERFPEIS